MKSIVFFALFLLSQFISSSQIITTIAGNGGIPYMGEGGPATAASIGLISNVVVDKHNCIYIVGGYENRRILKVDYITGIISTYAGTGLPGHTGDGGPATAANIDSPVYACFNTSGDLHVMDIKGRIRKIDFTTGVISTIAGTGVPGYNGDNILATSANIWPSAFAFDRDNNLYIGDLRRIRKINNAGIITTIAGNGVSGVSGDGGPASSALVNNIGGICVDKHGSIYFSDSSQCVRKIDASTGIVSRVAGTGDGLYLGSGHNVPATSAHIAPFGVSIDLNDNLYICDVANSVVEKVTPDGKMFVIVGTIGVVGYSGDGGMATSAQMRGPQTVYSDGCGNLYISDFGNRVVRKVLFEPVCTSGVISTGIVYHDISVFPNPTTDAININHVPAGAVYALINAIGAVVQQGSLRQGSNRVAVGHLPAGVYQLHITNGAGERVVHKIVKQ